MANDQKEQKSLSVGGTPIFAGKTALIRFVNPGDSNSSSIWLAERGPKVIRPFVSEEFFDSMFTNPQQAQKAVVTMSSDELGPEGLFKDFKVLDEEHAVQPDGSMKPVQFSPSQIQKRYGQPINPEAENSALSLLDGMLGQLTGDAQPQSPEGIPTTTGEGSSMPIPEGQPVSPEGIPTGTGGPGSGTVYDAQGGPGSGTVYDGQGGPATLHTYGVDTRYATTENEYDSRLQNLTLLAGGTQGSQQDAPKTYWDSVRNDPDTMGFYIGAIAYGGYTEQEVYAELLRMYKAEKDPSLYKTTIIDPTIKKSVYVESDAGKSGQKYFETAIPKTSGMGAYFNVNNGSSFLNKTALAAMPEDIFKLPPENRDQTDASFKEDAAKIKEAYWDGFIEKIKADTVAEDALADSNYKTIVDEIDKRYGMKMSDDSETAEQQLKNLDKSASMSGALGGEEYTRARKDIQKAMKKASDRDREAMTTEKEAKQFEKIQTSGTPEEIAAFKAEHPDKASIFDVSAEEKAKFSLEQMAIDYPSLSVDERQELRDTMFDNNGNRRSTIWAKYYQDKYDNMAKMRSKQVEDMTIKEKKAHQDYLTKYGMEDETDLAGNPTGGMVPLGTNDRMRSGAPRFDAQTGVDKPAGATPPGATDTTPPAGSTYTAKPAPTVNIQKGSTDQTSIKQLQDYLVDQGYMTQDQVNTGYGTFGPQTIAALTSWQKANGVGDASSWGNWGPKSIAKVPTAVATPTAPVTVNKAKEIVSNPQGTSDVNATALDQMRAEEARQESLKKNSDGTPNFKAIEDQQKATDIRKAEEARQNAIKEKATQIQKMGGAGQNEWMNSLSSQDRALATPILGNNYVQKPADYSALQTSVNNMTSAQASTALAEAQAKLAKLQATPITNTTSSTNNNSTVASNAASNLGTGQVSPSASLDQARMDKAMKALTTGKYAFSPQEINSQWNTSGSNVSNAAKKIGYTF